MKQIEEEKEKRQKEKEEEEVKQVSETRQKLALIANKKK